MRKIQASNRTIDIVFVLTLFCIFAASVLLVLLAGAGAYRNIAGQMEEQYTERTCLAYLDAKVRHYDRMDLVQVEPFGEGDALALYENIGDVRYKTIIYYYDGYVRELFFEDGLEFHPEDGEIILPACELQVSRVGENLLRFVCIGQDGLREQLLVSLHSGKGDEVYG